jgi:membrane protease YdiL (CAAX protease family)
MAPLLAVNAGLLPAAFDQLGAFSASLAAIILAAIEGRRGGVRELLGRFLIWRVGLQWWAFALLSTIIPSVLGLYLFQMLGGPAVDWSDLKPITSVIPMIILLTVLAGMGEEFGWRGFLLPRLQARHNALVSSIYVGLTWGAWHAPLFFTKGTAQYQWITEGGGELVTAIVGYTVFCVAWAIQYTWLFNNTRGSVLLACVLHGAGNAWIGGYINVYRSDFGGILTFTAVMVVVSIIIALLAGATHLSRKNTRNVLEPESMLPVEAVNPVGI